MNKAAGPLIMPAVEADAELARRVVLRVIERDVQGFTAAALRRS